MFLPSCHHIIGIVNKKLKFPQESHDGKKKTGDWFWPEGGGGEAPEKVFTPMGLTRAEAMVIIRATL